MILIAECGNNHFGDFEKAKEMVMAASESGAFMVKFQAFEAKDIVGGSMPKDFYEKCAFTLAQYKELIAYGRSKGVGVFYSVFSDSLKELTFAQRWRKISGKQTVKAIEAGDFIDRPGTFVSFPKTHLIAAATLRHAVPLYVCEYLTSDPELFRLHYLHDIMAGRPFGYSDHTVGNVACELAVKEYGCRVVEKHFTMEKNMSYRGQVFRDTIHGATPKEFRHLANLVKV